MAKAKTSIKRSVKKTRPVRKKGSKSKTAGKRTAAARTGLKSTGVKKSAGRSAKKTSSSIKRVKRGAGRATAKRESHVEKNAAGNHRLSATSQDPIQFPERQRKIPRTYLSAKELREFRALLLKKRAELCGDVERLSNEALNHTGSPHGEQSSMPIHMADLGTDNWEREFTLGLIANERALVREIDEALERIEKKTYGICLATHNKIETARLRAKPWAKYCIEYARAREEGRIL